MKTPKVSPDLPPVVVCVSDHPGMDTLLRAAAATAGAAGRIWYALYVETPAGAETLSPHRAERLLRNLTQAERLGASIAKIKEKSVAVGIRNFVRGLDGLTTGLPLVVMGQTRCEGIWARLQTPLARRVAEMLKTEADFQVILLPQMAHPFRTQLSRRFYWGAHWWNMLAALAVIGVALLLIAGVWWGVPQAREFLPGHNLLVLFLVICVFVTGCYGLLPGLMVAVVGGGGVHFFLTPLLVQWGVASMNIGSFLLFLFAAGVIAAKTAYTLSFARLAQEQEQRTNTLYRINRTAFSALTREESLNILYRELRQMLHRDVAYFLPDALHLDQIVPVMPETVVLGESEQEALGRAWRDSVTTGVGTADTVRGEWRFEPMLTPRDRIGVIGVRIRPGETLDPLLGRTLSLVAHQSAVVIERLELAFEMEQSRLQSERERLRSNLLSSVSHDLKTPLASIIGALSVYHTMKAHLTEDRKDTLTETALEEAQRLNSFISNIIDMARLESGDAGFHAEWQPPQDLVLRVKRALRYRLKGHDIVITGSGDPCEILVDVAQTEQALHNILDNAIKYSAPGAPIEISIDFRPPALLVLAIRDHGPGIPESARETIFDKYTRLKKEDSQVAGTGLGLAIARAILEHQQGRLSVHNHPDGGAVFVLEFPKARLSPVKQEG